MKVNTMPFSCKLVSLIRAITVSLGLRVLLFPTLLLSPTALKAEQEPASGVAYGVDAKASRIYVKVEPDGRGHAHGIAGELAAGAVTFRSSEKPGEFVFALTSLVADTPEARKYVGLEGNLSASDQRNVTRTMLGRTVLDTMQYPKATYAITSISPLDRQAGGEPGRYQLDGRLQLHGVENPVRFEAKVEHGKTEGTLAMRGHFALLQTAYKIRPYSFVGLVKVKDELQIYGDLLLVPKGSK
jgi:polyisoprenoid-binding protein YceI